MTTRQPTEVSDDLVAALQARFAEIGIDLPNPDGTIPSPGQMRRVKV